jgi:hypothetical protein
MWKLSFKRINEFWQAIAALVYLFICVFDFVAMPIAIEAVNSKPIPQDIVAMVEKVNNEKVQLEVIQNFSEKRTWNPLTLIGGGIFHLAFGAIVGSASFTQGMAKRDSIRNGFTASQGERIASNVEKPDDDTPPKV